MDELQQGVRLEAGWGTSAGDNARLPSRDKEADFSSPTRQVEGDEESFHTPIRSGGHCLRRLLLSLVLC